jgi:hypothetical protein
VLGHLQRSSDIPGARARAVGAYAVACGDVVDLGGEEVRVLAGGQVAAGEGQDFYLGCALACGRYLAVFIGIFVAAADVEGDCAVEILGNRGEVPPVGVAVSIGAYVEATTGRSTGDGRVSRAVRGQLQRH